MENSIQRRACASRMLYVVTLHGEYSTVLAKLTRHRRAPAKTNGRLRSMPAQRESCKPTCTHALASGACDAVCVIAASPVSAKQRVLAELCARCRESGAIEFRGRLWLRSITRGAIRDHLGRVQHAPRPVLTSQCGLGVHPRMRRPARSKGRSRVRQSLGGSPSRTARIFCRTVIHVPHQHEQRA